MKKHTVQTLVYMTVILEILDLVYHVVKFAIYLSEMICRTFTLLSLNT